MPVIGIDLGNTYSCMAVYRNDKPEVIHNHRSFRNTPNWIAFTEDERFLGDDAKDLDQLDAKLTVYDARRMIGRTYAEVAELAKKHQWPFELVSNEQGEPLIRVRHRGHMRSYSPAEFISMILRYLVECAEDVLGEPVKGVVLTVPSTFDDSRRRAIRLAGEMAGLNVIRLVRESTAAAIAFNYVGRRIRYKTVLVYDFGGGTFDATVIQVSKQIITKLAAAQDAQLGGETIDNQLVNRFMKQILDEYNQDIKSDKRALRQLRVYCERLKVQLSTAKEATITVEEGHLLPDQPVTLSLTREQFEKCNKSVFEKSFDVVRAVLQKADLKPSGVDEILLVGGSTRIPKVRELVQMFFPGKPVNLSLNPGEAVACGAAIVAATSAKVDSLKLPNAMLYEINVLALSIGQFGGIVDVFIPQNTPLPAGASKTFGTAYDNQTEVTITVFEGNRVMQTDNRQLTTITLSGLRPAPWGVVKFKVTFRLDENKCLKVSVAEMPEGVYKEVIISRDEERTSKEYFARMLADAEQNKTQDEIYLRRRDRWYRAYRYAVKTMFTVQAARKENKIDQNAYKTMIAKCDDTVAWFFNHETADESQFEPKIQELKKACVSVLGV